MNRRLIRFCMLFTGMVFLMFGCSARTYLTVGYQPLPASGKLAGQMVRLQVKDVRSEGATLSPSAAGELKGFRDRYSLSWLAEKDPQVAAGTHDLQNLFREAFQKRMQQMGAVVASSAQTDAPLFEVVIRNFVIDLEDRRWIVRAAYEARLIRKSGLVAGETVTGSAERLRIIGRKGADELLGEIFTEIVNRVDIAKLFQQAGLI